jgi:hypothetical protein
MGYRIHGEGTIWREGDRGNGSRKGGTIKCEERGGRETTRKTLQRGEMRANGEKLRGKTWGKRREMRDIAKMLEKCETFGTGKVGKIQGNTETFVEMMGDGSKNIRY